MGMRQLSLILVFSSLLGCVSEGPTRPLDTEQGRREARDAYVKLGLAYLQQGSTSRAKLPLSKALELDPNSAETHAALALVFQTELETKLADQHYRQAISANPTARILNNYGSFLYDQGRYEEALARFQQATNDPLYQERGRVFENLGLTSLKLGQTEQAREYFNRALRLDNQQPMVLLELAALSYDSKDYIVAKRYYDQYRVQQTNQQTLPARSLLLGIRLGRVFQDQNQIKILSMQLQRFYPASPEYNTYLSEQQ
ncbi:type IV pilus assembly protein PilF [Azomonas agilis]|uniref:Type IV pilus assembly protein PilF n=1 Tax=Azomonas agilis TaxID=116849 RepID=A0A562J0R2_9GAMM|nr:type IV pilus biogenesis/stability protein PilW [Azomonas agilis]TWH76690.1 type IV pilus assembly protein PilF [Azomonas agilis]